MIDVLELVRPSVLAIKPYSTARDEFTGEASVFLDANENPHAQPYSRYPDPYQWQLKALLAEIKHVEKTNLLLGNGSDECIDLLFRTFCEPNRDEVIIANPTYGMYEVSAAVNAVGCKFVPLTHDFLPDTSKLLAAVTATTKLLFICSPNNPSGNVVALELIEEILNEFKGVLVVDEAYIDFCEEKSVVKLIEKYPNVIVLQTLSKAWGLAGLRCGIMIAQKEIISVINKIKAPYNINSATQQLVMEALKRIDVKEKWVNEIIRERENLSSKLQNLSIVEKIYPSDANFLLVKFKNAELVFNDLLNKKIIVRNRSKVLGCENCLRITIGKPEENSTLMNALQELS